SSTRPRLSTAGTWPVLPFSTRTSRRRCRTSASSAGVAAPTTSTSPRSQTPSRREHVEPQHLVLEGSHLDTGVARLLGVAAHRAGTEQCAGGGRALLCATDGQA